MHLTTLLPLCLPLLTLADQVPLTELAQGWFEKAKSFIPSAIPNPLDAGASVIAAQQVERINIRNWQRKLAPKPEGEEEWLIYFTGGNKTCGGRCGHVDAMWNVTISPPPSRPPHLPSRPLHLGSINCDKDDVLCTALSSGVPATWHLTLAQKSPPGPPPQSTSPLHIVRMNLTTTTPQDFLTIPIAGKSRYLESTEYVGALHPVDGWAHKFGLLMPFGYALWVLGNTPSWLVMIIISFVSRQMMSRRMAGGAAPPMTAAPPVGGPAAGGAPPVAVPASPAGGAGGKGAKKRR